MVPAPRYDSFDDFNAHLEQKRLERQSDTLRGHTQTIGARLISDLDALMGLPPLVTLLRNALPGNGRRI